LIVYFNLIKIKKLDAQNNPRLQTSSFGDIFVGVQLINVFIVIMKVVDVLDHLHGNNEFKTFTNGIMTPNVKTTTYV
jgi:hypothetical protein